MNLRRIVVAAVLGLTGCGTYKHVRPVVLHSFTLDGQTNTAVAVESTDIRVFFQKLDATNLRTIVKDNGYSRTVSLGQIGTVGDAELVNAISEGVAEGLMKTQTGGMGMPSLTPPTPIPPTP